MLENLISFALALTRTSAFFLVLPVFGWTTVPVQFRVAFTVILALFFATIAPNAIDPSNTPPLTAVLLLVGEATYGLALGLIIAMLFSVVKLSAHIVERQMGLNMANVLDPLTNEEGKPLGSLIEMIFVLLFLSANGHHLFLLVLERSYEAYPLGVAPSIDTLTQGVIGAGSAMLVASLRLAAPALAAFLVLMVALALLARLVPEMNILFISMPMRMGMGLAMTAVFLPFVAGFIKEMADWMAKLLPL